MVSERRLSDVLSEFARTLTTDFPIEGILDRLVANIVDLLPIDAAGVSLITPANHPQLISGSDESAERYEHLQTELGEGPCIAAYQTGQAISIPDLTTDDRFPQFAAHALKQGLVAVFTFPLRNDNRTLGALDLYRRSAGQLSARDLEVAQTLADVTTAYLLNAQARLATGNLVAGVSHELRAPMTSMIGFMELLRSGDEALTPDQTFFVDSMQRGVTRVVDLADDLLTLATVNEPAAPHEQVPVDLVAVIDTVRRALAPSVAARKVEVTFDVPNTPAMVLGSSQELESLVLNLLTNALKFTKDGGWVRCQLTLAPEWASLEISDNGLGIPVDELPKLFQRFFRSSTAKAHHIQGTGLGLTIVESIAKNHGGTITVVSEHLKGSTFAVTLPLLVAL